MTHKPASRVVLLEDSLPDVELIFDMLDQAAPGQFHINHVSRMRDALSLLAAGAADFILTDMHLPDSQGIDTLLQLRRAAPQLPIIIFSSVVDEGLALQAVGAGAQDYLVKGQFDGKLLVRAIRYAIERRELEGVLQQNLAQLETRVQERTAELEAANQRLQNEVAERKRAEVSLRQSEHRLLQYLEAMPVGITVVDAAGRPYYINRTAKQLFAKEEVASVSAEQVSQAYGVYLANSDQLYPFERRSTTRALAGELTTVDDMEIRNGERIIPIESSGAPIYDEAGNVELAISVIRDISELKRSQAQLRESEQRFRAVFENGLEAMMMLDDSGTIIEANNPAIAMFGRGNGDLPGQMLPDLVNPTDGDVIREMWRELLRQGELSGEYKYKFEDGEVSEFEFKGRADFVPHYHLILVSDVTARHRAEEARLAREVAEQANLSKSQFLSNMSHELRTPLNSILGFAQLLTLTDITAEQSEYVNFVLKAGQHLLSLISEVLDIARIEGGRFSISLEPVLLEDAISQSIELAGPLGAGRNIKLQTEWEDAVRHSYVLADRQRLIQALLNLISNAMKYNRDGGKVLISCLAAGDKRLRIAISDTGDGISADKIPLLFTPFERLGAETSGIEGTGLGLALSKLLVEAMDGSIGAASMPGQGSTFWIELQLAEIPVQAPARKGTGPLALPAEHTRSRTVLCIEDNPASLQLITRILAHQPEVTLLASHSGLGIELARENKIDLVLLDSHLPDISGDEALRRLKADPKTSAIPVVVISADATAKQISNMLAAGAYAYLTKPLDVKQFLRVIADLFGDETAAA